MRAIRRNRIKGICQNKAMVNRILSSLRKDRNDRDREEKKRKGGEERRCEGEYFGY